MSHFHFNFSHCIIGNIKYTIFVSETGRNIQESETEPTAEGHEEDAQSVAASDGTQGGASVLSDDQISVEVSSVAEEGNTSIEQGDYFDISITESFEFEFTCPRL